MNFNIYNSIILAGVIQGLLFGVVVFMSKKYKNKSVYILASIIVIYSLSNLQFYVQDVGIISYDDLLNYYYIPWGNLVPVLFYFYVISYLNTQHKFSPIYYALFLPFIISFLLAVIYKIGIILDNKSAWLESLKLYLEGYDELISGLFHIIIFIILIVKVNQHKKNTSDFSVSIVKVHVDWIITTFIAIIIVAVVWIIHTIMYMQNPGEVSFYPLWILMAILIYWFGHIGIYNYGIVEERKKIRKKRKSKIAIEEQGKTKHIIIVRLKHFLEDEKRFLDASLTLEKTAEALELSQGHLSKIINTELGISFKDYINALRVEEAKSYLADDAFSNYTLVAIGLEAGFNSKSAFNSSFKKITGETPSQFKRKHIN